MSDAGLAEVLDGGALRAVFQPIVHLDTREPVGVESLCRGPAGHALERPDLLFRAAAATGRTAELDWAAREVALRTALELRLAGPALLFLNAEPDSLGRGGPAALTWLREAAADAGVRVVVEITERELTSRPAELLAAVARVRELGWAVALDDVGAQRESLALLPFLAPDVVKLDLRLVQQRTTMEVAAVVNAVRAQAERTGALLLAEGLETEAQADLAVSMGATLGQGWLFGRPEPSLPERWQEVRLPGCRPPTTAGTPWTAVSGTLPVRRATKPLLVAMSKTLEQQALATGESAVVIGTFQHVRHFTPSTTVRYGTLASSAAFVAALGTGIPAEPAAGVRGTHLDPDDALTAEWDLAVVGPHFAGALIARDLGDAGPDRDRRFDYCVTYDRDLALAAAARLMEAVSAAPSPEPVQPARVLREQPPVPPPVEPALGELLSRAVDAAVTGITVADTRQPDSPLIFVNAAFERLSGVPADQALGRNCRFMQAPETDQDSVRMVREQLRAGRPVTATLLNVRPDGTRWWNELSLSPVRDPDGQVTHVIGIQSDVTARIDAERRLSHLASHDPLTGLLNRSAFYERLEHELRRSTRAGLGTGVLYVDVDGFKQVNDELGHAAGDDALMRIGAALRSGARPGDVVARLGGDEFAAVVPGLPQDPVAAELAASGLARRLAAAVRQSTVGGRVRLSASVGVALHPRDAAAADALVAAADRAMYQDKTRRRASADLGQGAN